MSEQSPKGQPVSFNIPTRLPDFMETRENTDYANMVNVAFDGTECCLTFLRKPRPLSLDVKAVKAGDVQLEMTAVSRVYLPLDVARALSQAMAQNLAALDRSRSGPGSNGKAGN